MENKLELYKNHVNDMFGVNKIEDYSEEEIDRIIERMLEFLPNDGKLYKYKSLEGESFKNTLESLKEGYIWLAKASSLNDEFDGSINFDPEKDMDIIKNEIFQNPVEFLNMITNYFYNQNGYSVYKKPIDKIYANKIVSCYNKETGELDKDKAVKLIMKMSHYNYNDVLKYVEEMEIYLNKLIFKNEDALKQMLSQFLTFNKTNRDKMLVFSLTENYNSDIMWSYYTYNKGVCIEYDFNLIKKLPLDIKRYFISIYKVIYGEKDVVSFVDDFKYFLSGKVDSEYLKKGNAKLLPQIITKKKQWKNEKEWRLVLFNIENKLYANIVSSIFMTDETLKNKNVKEIIEVAKNNSWNIKVRKLNFIQTGYTFVEYNE